MIESGSASIAYHIVLTPYEDGLIRRPSRSWDVVSFSGSVKDLIVFVERVAEKSSKVHMYVACILIHVLRIYMYISHVCIFD